MRAHRRRSASSVLWTASEAVLSAGDVDGRRTSASLVWTRLCDVGSAIIEIVVRTGRVGGRGPSVGMCVTICLWVGGCETELLGQSGAGAEMLGGRLIGLCSRVWVVVDVRAAEADGAAVSRGAIDQVVLRRESAAAVVLGGARCVAAILCRLERHEFERGRVLGGVVGRAMADCYCAISPAVGASEFGAVFELIERLVPWRLSPLVVAVGIGFGVASAQHA